MRVWRILVCCWGLGLLAGLCPLAAQGPGRLPERIFTEEHGLASLAIYTLVQDQRGFLWAGTEAGLHRFDGHQWELLNLDLPNSWVEMLLPDSQGRLWIGCRSGLAVLEQGQLRRVEEVTGRITHLGEDREHRIWVVGSEGPKVLEGGTWRSPPKPEGPDTPTALWVNPNGTEAWLVGGRSLWKGDGRGPWTLERLPLDLKRESLVGVAVDGDGVLWARSTLGVWGRPEGRRGAWKSRLSEAEGEAPDNPCVIRDAEGWVWITTLRGPVRLRGDQFVSFTKGGQFLNATALLVDREGSLWVGGGGIHQILARGHWHTYGVPEGLSGTVVWNLLRDRHGRLWAATEGGLCVAGPQGWRMVKRGFFTRLTLGLKGEIFAIGHPGGVLYRLDPDRDRVEALRVDCLQSGPELRGLGVDATGRVFVSNLSDGVAMGRPRGQGFDWSLVASGTGVPKDVWHLTQDRQHRIFLLSQREVRVWDGAWSNIGGVLDQNPYGLLALDERRILVTYFDKPVITAHRREANGWVKEATLEPLRGIPNLIIYASRLGQGGILWLATNKGLFRVPDEGRGQAECFRPREGIPGADPTYDGLHVDSDSTVWVGTTQGLGRLDPGVQVERPSLPATQILEVQSRGRRRDLAAPIQIGRGEDLVVTYAVNSWLRPASLKYESRIRDLESSWASSDKPTVRYPSLPPGRHVLLLRATMGEEGTSPATELAFEVLPAWWESLGARIAYLLGAGALVTLLVNLRQRQLRQRNEALAGLVQARTAELEEANALLSVAKLQADEASRAKSAFLAGMSHELRTPLNAILLYSELLTEDAEARGEPGMVADLRKIRASGQHLLGLVNGVLDLSKIEAGKMHLLVEAVDPHLLLEEVLDTLMPEARKAGNELSLDLGEGLRPLYTDTMKLRQILLNLGSNACKFTSQGRVTLGVRAEEAGLRFTVVDTGVGMTPEQAARVFLAYEQAEETISKRYGGTGLGLAIAKSFVELMEGRISLDSEEGRGTTVTVWLPWEPSGLEQTR